MNDSALHHEFNAFEDADVFVRVAENGDQIRLQPFGYPPDFVADSRKVSGFCGC